MTICIVASIPLTGSKTVSVLHEAQAYSLNERTTSIKAGLLAWSDAPWFGHGLGSLTVHDTAANLLANTGVIGLTLALGALLLLVQGSALAWARSPARARPTGLLLLLWLLLAGAAGGWPYLHLHYWLAISLAAASSGLVGSQQKLA